MTTVDQPLRVIQWTTGNIGRRSLHAIIGRDDMELVGVYAHGADKVGVDAAELAGWPSPPASRPPMTSTRCSRWSPTPAVTTRCGRTSTSSSGCSSRGVNVCSSAAWITGGKQSPEDRERIRKACEKGNSTIFGSGAHPGMTNMVGMVLCGACERVDEIRITESVDCSTYESAGTQAAMGFSQDPDTPGLAESVRRESEVFAESAAMMADAIGAKLDRMTFDVDVHRGDRRHRSRLHADPGGHRRRRLRATTAGGSASSNVVSVGFNWTMGSHVTPPEAARTRPRHPGLRRAQHAHRACTACRRRAGPSPASWASG